MKNPVDIIPFAFRIEWTKVTEHCVEFEAKEITGETMEGVPLYGDYGMTDDPDDITDVYLKGMIKFDACAHLYFNDYYHTCGPWGFRNHCQLMEFLYHRAMELMGQKDKWPAEVTS